MTSPLSAAQIAVLSLVAEQPRHGYEIEQVVTERGMRSWTDLAFSSIYYLLGKLERAGLVAAGKGHDVRGRGPARTVYAATAEGRATLATACLDVLRDPHTTRPFLLGLANLPVLDLGDAQAAVAERAEQMAGQLGEMADARARAEERVGDGETLPWFVAEVFDFSEAMARAERAYLTGLLDRIHRHRVSEETDMTTAPAKPKATTPQLLELPALTMAVFHFVGDPDEAATTVFPALYGAAYALKYALKKTGVTMTMGALRARWFAGEDWQSVPREQWTAAWALPIPEGTTELVQKVPATPVVVERWDYGTVAQVLHVGPYAAEPPTIASLHRFIEESGYEICGPHEEEYLTRPGAKVPKTVIRYAVRRRGRTG